MSKEKVFVIDGPNVHYVVNPNTEEGREDARVFLSDFEGVPYKWFKEATGKEHWVMYDSSFRSNRKVWIKDFTLH